MSNEPRPPLDLNNLWLQVTQNAAVAKIVSKPPEEGNTLSSDEVYAQLMRPCKGPNDDPTKGDLA
jgi:hypothetical protein